jgi:hypothetical protein
LAISLPEDVIKADPEEPMEITMTNISDRPIPYDLVFGERPWANMFDIKIRNSDGTPVVEKPGVAKLRGWSGSGMIWTIKPGQEFMQQVILNRAYDLSKPGTYIIEVQRYDGISKTLVKSNVIGAKFGQRSEPAGGAKPSFSIILKAPYNLIKAGYEVPLEMEVRNLSKQELRFADWHTQNDAGSGVDNEFGVGFDVRDQENKPLSFTKSGRALEKGDDIPYGQFTFVTVQPEQNYTVTKLLGGLYDISKPGKYAIQVAMRDPASSLLVKSNTVNVTVLPNGPGTLPSTAPSSLLSIGTMPEQATDGSKKLMVLLAVTNMSDHEINFDRNLERNDIEVRDDKGNLAPLTEMGRKLRNEFGTAAANPLPLAVHPGQTTGGGAFYLDDVYDLKRPGQYTIQLGRFDDETNIFTRSNTITLTLQ